MANISTENINTLAQIASSIGDGDYIYIFKGGAKAFSRIEKSLFMQEMGGGGSDISDILSNDWNDSSRKHVPSARQMNLMYNNLISVYNSLTSVLNALANSSFKTARPEIAELDWVGDTSSYTIGYNLTHCQKTSSSPTSVAEGDSFTATIIPDAGYTLNGVQATGTGFTQVYDSENDRININASNVQNGLTIGCVAATFQVGISYNLVGFDAENNTTMQSGGSFTKVLSPNKGYSVRNIVIMMGGVALDNSQVWDSSTNTISIPVVTGDITITATAEETTDHVVTYDVTGFTKTTAPTTVADNEPLSVVLTKDDNAVITEAVQDGAGWGVSGGLMNRMNATDILVLMGGVPLNIGKDSGFTVSVSNNRYTINIAHVTGDVQVVYIGIVYDRYLKGDNSTVKSSDSNRYTYPHIPIPPSCAAIRIYHNYINNSNGKWAAVIYDETKTRTASVDLNGGDFGEAKTTSIEINLAETAPSGHRYLRTSFYDLNVTKYGGVANLDGCYIYDLTNRRFLWAGVNAVEPTN